MTFLTIAIPTYNRVNYLQELLPELLRQCKPYPEIEIIVSNNCSTDGTADYLATVPGIQTWTNTKNVGGNKNQLLCIESSRGKYIWVFGDDELICNDAIDSVMDTLKVYPVSLLIVGGADTERVFCIGTYSNYIKNNTVQNLVNQTLISCNIFKKDIFDCDVARKYQNTDYGFIYSIMGALKRAGTIFCIHHPIISIREQRAQNLDNLNFIKIKQLIYLRYLGLPNTRILSYIYTGILWPSALRQIKKIKWGGNR